MLLKWQDIVSHGEKNTAVLNVHDWMVRGTLDALGEGSQFEFCFISFVLIEKAAFDYRFGTIENDSNELARSYHNLAYVIAFKRRSNESSTRTYSIGQIFLGIQMLCNP